MIEKKPQQAYQPKKYQQKKYQPKKSFWYDKLAEIVPSERIRVHDDLTIGILGDTHIPSRASKIPDKIWNKISECDLILFTGDFIHEEVLNLLRKTGKNVKAVKGNSDYVELPTKYVIQVGKYTIGLTHGSEVFPRGNKDHLVQIAKKMNANILVHGHTHKQEIFRKNNILFLNPGTATGAPSYTGEPRSPHALILIYKSGKLNIKKI
jgi:putative phosphoesterase